MKPKAIYPESRDIFEQSLVEMINLKHPPVKLGDTIDWEFIIEQFGGYLVSDRGRPGNPKAIVAAGHNIRPLIKSLRLFLRGFLIVC